uniref:Ribonuclease Z n=1 Tax=Clandestinovirus TaxID=2831644 RepID=A0A8F8KR02_9VIRU|nr:ribonuclease Z [Clandestinovirus]
MLKKFSFKNWTVIGSSIASDQTTLLIKEFSLCFDMGHTFPACVKKAKTVAISHGHQDHIGSIHLHIRKRLRNNLPGCTYILPKICEEPFRYMYSSVESLDEGRDTVQVRTDLSPIAIKYADDSLSHQLNNSSFLKCFDMIHKIPSKGYTIFETRRKLKPEYRSLSIIDIEKVKKESNVEIEEIMQVPLISFSGDTTIEGVLRCQSMLESKLLILECTYIDDKVSQQECKNRGHVHLKDIVENWNHFQNEHILLVHLSPRYTKVDVEKARSTLPFNISQKITFFDLCQTYNE